MTENDIRAVTEILFEIRNNPILLPGFERLLHRYDYREVRDLCKTFQKLCDSMDEWGNPVERIYIMEDIKIGIIEEGTSPEAEVIHGMEVEVRMSKKRGSYDRYTG